MNKKTLTRSTKTLVLALGYFGMASSLSAETAINYYETIKQAVKLSPTSQMALQKNQQQAELIEGSKAGFRPKIGLSMNSGYSDYKDDTSTTPEITLTQNVYDFGRTRNQVRQVEAESLQVKSMNQIELESIAQRTAFAYIQTQRSKESLEQIDEHIKAIESVVGIANERALAGASSQSDLTQAQARLTSAKLMRTQIETELLYNKDTLKILLNLTDEPSLETMPSDLLERANISSPINFEDIPQYKEARDALSVSNAQLDLAKSEQFPQMNLQLSSNKTIDGVNPGTGERYGSDHRVDLQFSYELYQGGATGSRINASTANKEAARYKLLQLKQDLQNQINTTRIGVMQLQSKQALLDERIVTLNQTRDIYKEQYQLGSRSILDLLNVEQEIYQATSEKVNAEHDYWNAISDYVFISGQARKIFELPTM